MEVKNRSNYPHEGAGLGNYKGGAFTTGCYPRDSTRLQYSTKQCNLATEILNMTSEIWSYDYPDYPYTDKRYDSPGGGQSLSVQR